MKLLLDTFTTTLDAALVEKGKKWYSEEMVQNVQNVSKGVWHADIIGPNRQFKVQVEISGKKVNHVFCGCGPKLCSHVVALLIELVEKNYIGKNDVGTKVKTRPKGASRVQNSLLTQALQNANEDDLKEFIKEHALNDKEFLELFLSKFGKIDIESHVARFRSVIKSTLKYDREADAIGGTHSVLKDALIYFNEKNFDLVFAACKAVLTEWAPFVYNAKHAGIVFADALKQLHSLVLSKNLSEQLKYTLLNYIYQLYKRPDIEDYQDGDMWTDAFILLSTSKEQLEKVIRVIDAKLENASEYHKRDLLKHKQQIEKAIKRY
jgi:hypothetical protein